jgi:hypothetical protein
MGRAKSAAKKVAGRKAIVMNAIVFMDELSCFVARAIVRESFASSMLAFASSLAIRLNIWRNQKDQADGLLCQKLTTLKTV